MMFLNVVPDDSFLKNHDQQYFFMARKGVHLVSDSIFSTNSKMYHIFSEI
ncbi:unnamed protein product [Acanthoscelides obtectus]|uniref:Uncharacterized protein n=1 Tax=Acanthoscelides obtectus TaxID=200917 RepID=A0A9P0LZI7_ACAOB|nr:unnamed protein product [Acanthoscelides obtectus]CAK1634085.1 hypothetical protein AOBTE_LOCUS8595 [Acanthoscelides obtectus]